MSLVELPVECFVKATDKYLPLTGVHASEETISGWRWDRKVIGGDFRPASRHQTYLGGHAHGLRDGTKLLDWQSGTLDGCGYKQLRFTQKGHRVQWVPQVEVGEYSTYWNRRPLFSDYSMSTNLTTDVTMNDRYIIALQDEELSQVVLGSLFVAIWKRLDDFTLMTIVEYQQVGEFTPLPEYGSTLDEDGNVVWAQVSDIHNEYTIDDDRLVQFNNLKCIEVAIDDLYEDYIEDSWEAHGPNSDDGRTVFANYFPFEPYSVRVATVDSAGDHIIWEEVTSFRTSAPGDRHYVVNYDLGTIRMGGFRASPLILKTGIDTNDTEILVYVDEETLDDYPDQGVILIGSEKIFYAERGYSGFYQCTRGYDGSTAAVHAVGVEIQDTRHGFGNTDEIYISYRAVPRVDMEVTEHQLRSANRSQWVDVRASSNVETNNILQILSANINLAELTLEIDRPLIGGTLYGPVYYGTDSGRLTATGLDSRGNPVEDIDITIEILDGTGLLDGESTSITKSSNSLGKIYGAFHAPYSDAEVAYDITSVTHDAGNTLMEVSGLPLGISVSDIWVFQVLKRDPFRGTVGKPGTIAASGLSGAPNGDSYITIEGRYDDNYRDGKIYVLTTANIKRSHTIVYSEVITSPINGHVNTRVFVEGTFLPVTYTGQPAWLLTSEDIEWDPVEKRGQRVILYEWSTDATHPITDDPGAYTPVHPSSISGTTLTFDSRELAIPDANDDTVELGAYMIVAPGETTFVASAQDPFTNLTVTSNQLRVRVSLPQSLLGVDSSGALPVPYGFKFAVDEYNLGSGIGGANFITINPRASGINQFTFTGTF